MVCDLDDRLGGMSVDELDTKARVGEVRGDIDLQVGNLRSGVGRGLRILGLREAEVLDAWHARKKVQNWSHAEHSRAEQSEGWLATISGSRATHKRVDLHLPRRRRQPQRGEPEEQESRA